jgi:hypothetical protein
LNAQGALGEEIVIESVSALEKPLSPALGEARFVEPVTAVIAAVSLASFAKYIVAHYLKSKEHGVQIDLRTEPATLTEVPNVSTGREQLYLSMKKARLPFIKWGTRNLTIYCHCFPLYFPEVDRCLRISSTT